MVISIEAKKQPDGTYEAYTDNGREKTGVNVFEWAKRVAELGAGEILLTSIDQEGTGKGFDIALTVRHPSAICSPWAQVGGGSVLFAGAVVNAGAILGQNVIINSGAVVEHDCLLGDHVHVATGAKVGSTVRIGAGAHIGIGVSVRQRIVVGEGAVVGAGSVLVKDVEAWTVVAGVPAHPMSARIKT